MEKLSIVKIGGKIIEDPDLLEGFLNRFANLDGNKILVHGGGKKADKILTKLGIEPNMVNGRRVTDAETLDVALMVYGGLANKTMVAKLQAKDCNAIGLSGADANTIQAHKRPVKEVDFGFVGDVDKVNHTMVEGLLNLGLCPVFCALTHDGNSQMLNTNADTIACELAKALSGSFKTELSFCFEFTGVMEDIENPASLIQGIDSDKYESLKAKGIISKGMLPKLHNCFDALKNGVHSVRIGGEDLFNNQSNNYTSIVL